MPSRSAESNLLHLFVSRPAVLYQPAEIALAVIVDIAPLTADGDQILEIGFGLLSALDAPRVCNQPEVRIHGRVGAINEVRQFQFVRPSRRESLERHRASLRLE